MLSPNMSKEWGVIYSFDKNLSGALTAKDCQINLIHVFSDTEHRSCTCIVTTEIEIEIVYWPIKDPQGAYNMFTIIIIGYKLQ